MVDVKISSMISRGDFMVTNCSTRVLKGIMAETFVKTKFDPLNEYVPKVLSFAT